MNPSLERIIPPSMRFKAITIYEYKRAYENSIRNLDALWSSEALALSWRRKWASTRQGDGPYTRWFSGGLLSPYENIVARHKDTGVWGKAAIIQLEENGDAEALTFSGLDHLISKIHCGLKNMGLSAGDWVAVYSPPNIESFAFMLAAIRAGLPVEPIFTGFSPQEMSRRVLARKARGLFVTAEYTRRGKTIEVAKASEDQLTRLADSGVKVVIHGGKTGGKYVDFAELLSYKCNAEDTVVESTHPLFGLHSGYEEDFKPITHPTGGFLVQAYATSRWIGLRPRDTVFCTVWPGWITGVTYQLFGPLMLGSTVLLYTGGPDWPNWGIWLDIIDSFSVTLFITTSSAVRLLSKQDPSLLKGKNDTLREVIITAEPLEPEYWRWSYDVLGSLPYPVIDSTPGRGGTIPVLNMFIQSEVGTFLTGNLVNYTFTHIIPGSSGPPIPGFALDVLDGQDKPIRGKPGRLVIKAPWPSIPIEAPAEFYSAWRNNYYDTGDIAIMSEEYYIFPLGRGDGVLKVSGYRLSPGALEKNIASLSGVDWVLVAPLRNPERFETPIVLYHGDVKEEEITHIVREKIGPIASPGKIISLHVKPSISPSQARKEIAELLYKGLVEEAVKKLESIK
ncbi:MAG: acyl-CoA synthetase [Infirmifilum sp.]